jgi:transketolase
MGVMPKSSLLGCNEALSELQRYGREVVVLDCDKCGGGGVRHFAEQHVILEAAGLALGGNRVFLKSAYNPVFIARAYEQIRSAVCIPNLSVALIAAHDGPALCQAGAARQANEDFAIMRALPGMTVLEPSDKRSAYVLTASLMSSMDGPVYMRASHYGASDIYSADEGDFSAGGARLLKEGDAVTICASGTMVREALAAAESLASQGIMPDVIDCYSIKPFPERILLASVRRTGCCVVAEKHTSSGGLFGAVAECLCRGYPVPVRCVSVEDRFGQSGAEEELREYYGLTHREIEHNVLQVWAIRRR